jgi:hypothetical protein
VKLTGINLREAVAFMFYEMGKGLYQCGRMKCFNLFQMVVSNIHSIRRLIFVDSTQCGKKLTM